MAHFCYCSILRIFLLCSVLYRPCNAVIIFSFSAMLLKLTVVSKSAWHKEVCLLVRCYERNIMGNWALREVIRWYQMDNKHPLSLN